MKYPLFITLVVTCLLGVFNTSNVFAQQSIKSNSVNQAHFQQLSLDQQRILVHDWINQSGHIEVPVSFESNSKQFFIEVQHNEKLYQKYSAVFKPLFNENLALIDRINLSTFLISTFGEDEIPLDLIRAQKEILIKLSTK